MSDKTSLGDRMKSQYERRAQTHLPRRSYTILRLDGKAFHTYTRGLQKPYDEQLGDDFAAAVVELCREAQGVEFAYLQSDEVSLLLTDFATPQTDAWFDGNVQKIASVSASVLTAAFNARRYGKVTQSLAYFDARAFTIPDRTEVENYFIWRQQDCTRNSISSLAQAHFPHKELQGLNTDQLQEKLWAEADVNWADSPRHVKNGVVVRRVESDGRSRWQVDGAPVFTQERWLLTSNIPAYA